MGTKDIGQMNLYLNYFKHEVCTEGDNEPFGIVLGAEKDRIDSFIYADGKAHAAKPDGSDNLLPFIAPEPKE